MGRNGVISRRAGCAETCTSGSEGGPGKRTGGNTGTAPRSDPYTATLQSAARLAEPPPTAALEVQAGVEVKVRLPLEVLARVDEAAAAARGRVHRGDLIRTLLREGLGG